MCCSFVNRQAYANCLNTNFENFKNWHDGECSKIPSAGKLRQKSGKTSWAAGWEGHRKFSLKRWQRANAVGRKNSSPWFFLIVRKGLVWQRSLPADLIFLVLFVSRQKGLASAAIERGMLI